MDKSLDSLDLNLLRLLKVVVETRNTLVAAEKLGISQTSVSRGMAKLRETFGDQLFIRKAHGVEPSELAEKLAEAAEHMLKPFVEVIEAYSEFDPMEFEGEVTIAFELSLLEVFGVGAFEALAQALPKANLNVVYWEDDTLKALLDRRVDYILHYKEHSLPQNIYTHHLSDVKISLVARKNHPVLSKSSAWEDIHHLPLVKLVANTSPSKYGAYENAYLSRGYQPNLALVTHSIPVAVKKLESSDAIKFSSSYLRTMSDELACYDLPTLAKELGSVSVIGGYLQSKRSYPLNQYLHQTFQSFFDSVVQPDI